MRTTSKGSKSFNLNKLEGTRLLALDFDGVLTNGYVYFGQDGQETVRCSRKDSLGIDMLQEAGVRVVVISKETNPVVRARCEKMRVDCWQGIGTGEQKLDILLRYTSACGISQDEVVYIGDDVSDLPCIKFAGVGITVADGRPKCKAAACYITKRNGGEHAVREVCDLILSVKGGAK